MPSSQMFVPDKIKVGYQNRSGTYTGQLAYIVYYDEKGKLRKEPSWEHWRDKKIEPQEFENVPTEGFVLNKKAGGTGGWNPRNTYIRVWDPRNFEFEISVPNLLFILQECTATKGKGLEGEFVYAWDGTEIVLLPVEAAEYKTSKKYTGLQSKKITAQDMKPGCTYLLKNGKSVLYLGRYPYNEPMSSWTGMTFKPLGMRHIFKSLDDDSNDDPYYIHETGFTKLAEIVSSTAIPQFPDELDKYLNSKYHANIVKVQTQKIPTPNEKDSWKQHLIKEGEEFRLVRLHKNYNYYLHQYGDYSIYKTPLFTPEIHNGSLKFPTIGNEGTSMTQKELDKLEFQSLTIVTDKGTKIKVI